MTYWQDLLSEHPHTCHSDGHIQFSNPSTPAAGQPTPKERSTQLIPRTDLAVLRASGGDWRKMLQGQTTCDLTELSAERSVPGALCTPKGRMIANFRLMQDGDDVLLITPRSTETLLLDALRKFAPFFKVTLEPVELPLLATLTHAGSSAAVIAALADSSASAEPGANEPGVNQVLPWQYGQLMVISEHQLWVTMDQPGEAAWHSLTALAALSDTSVATLADIRDGLAWVTAATSDEFIPQMLALHRTGAVNFKKGCYTGQEVVARMQYLGKLKRQLYRLALQLEQREEAPAAGTPCYLPGARQNCGHVVMSAAVSDSAAEALVVLTEEGAASTSLCFGSDGAETAVSPLPLPLPELPETTA